MYSGKLFDSQPAPNHLTAKNIDGHRPPSTL
jgi:hypothetical protein